MDVEGKAVRKTLNNSEIKAIRRNSKLQGSSLKADQIRLSGMDVGAKMTTPKNAAGSNFKVLSGSASLNNSQVLSEDKSDNFMTHQLKKMKGKVFLSLGYGVNAYFDVLVSFIKLYFLMSLINVGLILIYYSYDGMRSLSGATFTSKVSIGNMGFSEPYCMTVNFGVDHSLIACPYGHIQKAFSFGIHPKENVNISEDNNVDLAKFFFSPRPKGVRCRNQESDVCNRYLD
jgi:hypothetical protein